jgi:hypothetical protein
MLGRRIGGRAAQHYSAKIKLKGLIPGIGLAYGGVDDEVPVDVHVRGTRLNEERDTQQEARQEEYSKKIVLRLSFFHPPPKNAIDVSSMNPARSLAVKKC